MSKCKSGLVVAILVVLCTFSARAGWADGGLYLDDFRITNNGASAFFDNFDDGKLDGWTKMHDASVFCTGRGRTRQCSMMLDKHQFCAATAYHSVTMPDAGKVEMSTRVYVTPPGEQYDYRKGVYCLLYITLYSGSSSSEVAAIVNLNPGEDMNRIGIRLQHMKNGKRVGIGGTSPNPVLAPNQWAALTLRLDPKSGLISVILDGKPIVVRQYDPARFASIREVGICSGYGDGSLRTD